MYKMKKRIISNGLFLLLYKFFLDYIYVFFVCKRYSYYGFVLRYDLKNYVISVIISLMYIVVAALLVERRGYVNRVLLFINVFYFIPGESLFGLSKLDSGYHFFCVVYFCFLCFYFILFHKFRKVKKIGICMVYSDMIIPITACIICVLVSLFYTGIRLSVDFSKVYQFRYEVRSLNIPGALRYLLSWSTSLLPIALTYSLVEKKRCLSLVIILVNLINFGFDGQKTVFFKMIIAVFIGLFYRENYFKYFSFACCGASGVSALSLFLRGKSIIADVVIRRMLFIPTYLGSCFYDMAKNNEVDYLRASVLKHFGAVSPYAERGIPKTIGQVYFNKPNRFCDTGLCGDAFMEFGWIGLFLYPLLLVLVLRMMEAFMKGIENRVVLMTAISYSLFFMESSFFTVLVSFGFIVVMIWFWMILPYNRHNRNQIKYLIVDRGMKDD